MRDKEVNQVVLDHESRIRKLENKSINKPKEKEKYFYDFFGYRVPTPLTERPKNEEMYVKIAVDGFLWTGPAKKHDQRVDEDLLIGNCFSHNDFQVLADIPLDIRLLIHKAMYQHWTKKQSLI